MIKLKLLAWAFILFGPCAYASMRTGRRPERTFAAMLCLQSIALVFLGYFLPFSIAMGIVAAVSSAAGAAALMQAIRERKRKALSLLIPFALLCACCLFLYEACADRVFMSFDEFSHWGMMVKAIALYDELPRALAGAQYIQYTYPPAAAMLPATLMALFGVRDGVAFFGQLMLIGGLMASLASRAGRENGIKTAAAFLLLYLCVMAVFPLSIVRLFMEPVMALLLANLVFGAIDQEGSNVYEDGIFALMLAMTKNTGVFFVVLALLIRLIIKPERREAGASLRILAVSLTGLVSYQVYCRVQGIEAVVSPSHFSQNLHGLLTGTLSESYANLPGRFFRFFFGKKLPDSGIYSCYGFGTSAAVMGLLLLLCAAHIAIAHNRRGALRLWGGVWLANILYLAMTVASYLVAFEPHEAEWLAEIDRYTMFAALWTSIMIGAMLIREIDCIRRKQSVALACACAAALLPVSHPEMTVNTFFTKDYADRSQWATDHANQIYCFFIVEMEGESDKKALCIGDYDYIKLHYMAAGLCDIGRNDHHWYNAPWSGSCEKVLKELESGDYDYVFVGGDYEGSELLAVDERYTPLTQDGKPLALRSLYRVERSQEKGVQLVYMATMGKAE